MKKKNITIFLAAFFGLAVVMASCWNLNSNEYYLRSMVNSYNKPVELKIEETYRVGVLSVSMKSVVGGTYLSPSEINGKHFYDFWCEKHGDMSYNRKISFGVGAPSGPHEFIAADYTAINIISDTDWDAQHPAGTSLNDIVMFYSASPIEYIKSGYKEKYNWNQISVPSFFHSYMENGSTLYGGVSIGKGTNPFHPVIKTADELTPEDMVLLGNGNLYTLCLLEFTSFPTENKDHNITVTLTTDEGETFSGTINTHVGYLP